jgi:Putative Ig domain
MQAVPVTIDGQTKNIPPGTYTLADLVKATGANAGIQKLHETTEFTSGTVTIKGGESFSSAVIPADGVSPVQFMASAGLPPLLTLYHPSGVIAGNPLVLGTFPFSVRVIDSTGAVSKEVTLSITIS